jgi:CBS domain-containing protein
MKVSQLLRAKPAGVITIDPDAGIPDAMRLLVEHNIGALVVTAGSEIAGIISERDMLRAAAADLGGLEHARVRELMTADVITASPDDDIDSVMNTLSERRVRHLPIVQDGALAGMISIGDVINALRRSTEIENRQLHAYIAGTPL